LKSIFTWNVNGIRAAVKNGLLDWIKMQSPDILCLQEIKADETQFPAELLELKDKYQFLINPARKKGYSGVAILTKKVAKDFQFGLDIDKFDLEGRIIIAEYEDFILYNGYYPNGQRDHGRVDYKLEFSEAVLQHALKNKKTKNKAIILCGDFNTAHHEIDLANPKTNKNTTGFLPHEREWMTRLIDHGFHDNFRLLHPQQKDAYTWWTYRGDCRVRNIGWRIDYFFTDDLALKLVKDCKIHPQILGSDHCPVELKIKSDI
jgi:exodeoxyribonuclease-3